MSVVASRDLRNHTADVLRQVSDGETVTITVNGRAVAEIGPVKNARPTFLSRRDLLALVQPNQADAGLTLDLQRLAGDTTDDLADL